MKRLISIPAFLCLGLLGCSNDEKVMIQQQEPVKTFFKAHLTGDSEVPTHSSNAYGAFDATFTSSDRSLAYELSTTAVPGTSFKPTVAHIHKGNPGVNGNSEIIFDLGPVDVAAVRKSITLTPDQVAILKRGEYYIHIHSLAFPEGDIRGQIRSQ